MPAEEWEVCCRAVFPGASSPPLAGSAPGRRRHDRGTSSATTLSAAPEKGDGSEDPTVSPESGCAYRTATADRPEHLAVHG